LNNIKIPIPDEIHTAKKNINASQEVFKNFIDQLCRLKMDFTIVSSGSIKDVIIESSHIDYKYNINKSCMIGSYIIRLVKDEVKQRVLSGEYVIKTTEKNRNYDGFLYSFFNSKGIEKCMKENNGVALAIDANDCYWNVLYNIGAISKELYEKGLKHKEWKSSRNASVGSLGKKIRVANYKDGIKCKKDDLFECEYWGVRMDVINYVYQMAIQIAKELGDDFYFFFTDCFYINPDKYDYVMNTLKNEYKLHTKTKTEKIVSFGRVNDNYKLVWRGKNENYFSQRQNISKT
jgi:hypothetical protein